ncbi:MAG: S-layer homology domain-containing protein, partial [Firmicutes bacterium]|nr:S-layer homology domain-containing protein [Bacillota bacterium]
MIKRFISLGICLLMVFSAVSSVFAAQPAFTDIDDLQTARDAEVLRLMGVIEGYGDGSFKPANSLTRAQFCKMAICMMGLEQDSAKYSNITIFPDVRASHWAAPYINLAAKGQKIIAGFDDGLFRPNQPITSGQAVTIILRIMGYKDDKVGGVWPDSFMAAGQSIGLLEGCGFTGGRQTITRAQAARIFVNMLTCELYGGGHLFTLTEETTFKSISADTGKMNCSDDVKYELVNKTEDSMLIGMTGKVVLDAKGRALSFIPSENSTGIYEGLVIASADGSTTGFAQLAGGTDYKIYRDGELSSASEIKKWDVATYNPQTKSMRLCSTRLRVYYEDCTGSPKSPETITIMGGKVFPVMDSAKAALAQFKPGQDMYVLFTIDGQVAGAVPVDETDIYTRVTGEVDKNGALTIDFCGEDMKLTGSIDPKYNNYAVILSSYRNDGPRLRYMNEDEVDGTVCYGRVSITEEAGEVTVTFECGPDQSYTFYKLGGFINKQRAAVKVYSNGKSFSWVDTMTRLTDVPNSTWLGKEAVTFGSGTYVIDKDTVFYNLDTESWST